MQFEPVPMTAEWTKEMCAMTVTMPVKELYRLGINPGSSYRAVGQISHGSVPLCS